jgi:hypothetical protein
MGAITMSRSSLLLLALLVVLPLALAQWSPVYYSIEDTGDTWTAQILDWSNKSPYITYKYNKTGVNGVYAPDYIYAFMETNIKNAYPTAVKVDPSNITAQMSTYQSQITPTGEIRGVQGTNVYTPPPAPVGPAEKPEGVSTLVSRTFNFTMPWWGSILITLAFIGLLFFAVSKFHFDTVSQIIVLICGVVLMVGIGVLPAVFFFLPLAFFLAGMVIRTFWR